MNKLVKITSNQGPRCVCERQESYVNMCVKDKKTKIHHMLKSVYAIPLQNGDEKKRRKRPKWQFLEHLACTESRVEGTQIWLVSSCNGKEWSKRSSSAG